MIGQQVNYNGASILPKWRGLGSSSDLLRTLQQIRDHYGLIFSLELRPKAAGCV